MTDQLQLTESEIKRQHKRFLERFETDDGYRKWHAQSVEMIEAVRSASPAELRTPEFQRQLWETNPVSGSGRCSVSMTEAIESKNLADWISEIPKRSVPDGGEERVKELQRIRAELVERTIQHTKRKPWLKIDRLLATFFFKDLTCVTVQNKLAHLGTHLFGALADDEREPVALSARILHHVASVVGPPGTGVEDVVKRSIFCWYLYAATKEKKKDAGEVEGERPGEEKLVFPSFERRRKGLTAIGGYLGTAVKVVEFARNGATIDEVKQFIHKERPKFKKGSVNVALSVVRHELGLLRLTGKTLEPSRVGQELLNTDDKNVVIPEILTRTIGMDCLLDELRKNGPRTRRQVFDALKAYYPKWTKDFMPSAILNWAKSLDLVRVEEGSCHLTESGARWADQLPDPLPQQSITVIDDESEDEDTPPAEEGDFNPSTLAEILEEFKKLPFVFPDKVIARLHVALHASPKKHFVILSGLSGTGKTKLAELYANAFYRVAEDGLNPHFLLVPVQPDWTDPSGLLGYVNPLREEPAYVGTELLSFLQSANQKPDKPFFLCLDEMNLARVEYYFAPFLSAMETGQQLVIHQGDEAIDAIDPKIDWPDNLFVIGTVNMDETTYAFSDKVLDRAFTIELWDVDLDEFSKRLKLGKAHSPQLIDDLTALLRQVHDILEPVHLHFGYRTASEIMQLVAFNEAKGHGVLDRTECLDQALLMKVLPKLRGQRTRELGTCMEKFLKLATTQGFKETARKLQSMRAQLEMHGTTRFWR